MWPLVKKRAKYIPLTGDSAPPNLAIQLSPVGVDMLTSLLETFQPVVRRRSTVSLLLQRENPKSESRTQIQTPLLHLRFRSQNIDRMQPIERVQHVRFKARKDLNSVPSRQTRCIHHGFSDPAFLLEGFFLSGEIFEYAVECAT
jgi:hypothetical protein